MSLIMMTTTTAQSVLSDGIVPLTTIARRKGCACQGGTNGVVIEKTGYYKVSGSITFTSETAGLANIDIVKNNIAVSGITASVTIGATTSSASDVRTLTFEGIIRVYCNEGNPVISILNDGVAINTSNVVLVVEEV